MSAVAFQKSGRTSRPQDEDGDAVGAGGGRREAVVAGGRRGAAQAGGAAQDRDRALVRSPGVVLSSAPQLRTSLSSALQLRTSPAWQLCSLPSVHLQPSHVDVSDCTLHSQHLSQGPHGASCDDVPTALCRRRSWRLRGSSWPRPRPGRRLSPPRTPSWRRCRHAAIRLVPAKSKVHPGSSQVHAELRTKPFDSAQLRRHCSMWVPDHCDQGYSAWTFDSSSDAVLQGVLGELSYESDAAERLRGELRSANAEAAQLRARVDETASLLAAAEQVPCSCVRRRHSRVLQSSRQGTQDCLEKTD